MAKKKKHALWHRSRTLDKRMIGGILIWGAVIALLSWAGALLTPNADAGDGATAFDGLVISEVMTGNSSTYPTDDGLFCDWFELWNSTDHAINLQGVKVSNDFDSRSALALPNRNLEAGERVVIHCSGLEDAENLHTSFTLDKEGDYVYLFLADDTLISMVEVPPLRKGEVYALDESSGEWTYSSYFTPGLENTQAAHNTLMSSSGSEGEVIISELMASNRSTLADAEGAYSDWIEIHNVSNAPVSLKGWSLSTNAANRREWSFPDITLQPGEYRVVFASGRLDAQDELHASFRLSAEGETLYLVDERGQFASILQYEALQADQSVSRDTDGGLTTAIKASPGYENTLAGADRALGTAWRTLSRNAEGLYINEVMCHAAGYQDWVEIYNSNSAAMDLSGWWLSDDANRPRKWEFPQGTTIAAGEYKLVALGSAASRQSSALTANFSLSVSGDEAIVLSRPDGSNVDCVYLYGQKSQTSYGRVDGQAQYRYFEEPTPGDRNTTPSFAYWASKVEFSRRGGKVTDGAFMLELKSAENLPIYYTLDGSNPGASSSLYTGPIQISGNTVVKAAAWSGDALMSETAAASYIFDSDTTLRLVCVSGDAATLNAETGVLNTGEKRAQNVCVEVYDYDGSQLLSQSCEMTMTGKSSLSMYGQKAFRLVARSIYGQSTFNARLFTNRDYQEYNSFVLRASGQDTERSHMLDSVLSSLAMDTEVFYQETELAAVYVNGQYWGMYNMRERVDPHTIAKFEGWTDPDGIDIVESSEFMEVAGAKGSSDDFKALMNFVHQADFTNEADMAALRRYCDVENYLDYVALQIYTANEDLNNLRVYRNTLADGKWRWILYDLDLGYRNDKNSFRMWLEGGPVGSITTQDGELFRKLMLNGEMRDYFLTRFGELLATSFSPQNVYGKIEQRFEAIKYEMQRSCERWGWSVSSWTGYVRDIAEYASTRSARLVEFAQLSFELSDAEVQKYFGAALEEINAFNG